MSIQDLIDLIARYPLWLVGYFLLPPILGVCLRFFPGHATGPIGFADYVYTVVVYLVCVPGMVSAVLVGYHLLFIRQNLLEVNLLVYFAPVASMVATLVIVGRQTRFDRLPGFDRLSGLMLMIGLVFLVLFVLFRMRILVGFFASFEVLLGLGVLLFVAFQYAAHKLFR